MSKTKRIKALAAAKKERLAAAAKAAAAAAAAEQDRLALLSPLNHGPRLLDLPRDVLRFHVLGSKYLDLASRVMLGRTCKALHMRACHAIMQLALVSAAEEGHIGLLKYFRRVLTSVNPRPLAEGAIRGNQVPVLCWLRENFSYLPLSSDVRDAAAQGHLEVLAWICALRAPAEQAGVAAAAAGHLPALRYLREKFSVRWTPDITRKAAENLHLHVLDWAVANGAPLSLPKPPGQTPAAWRVEANKRLAEKQKRGPPPKPVPLDYLVAAVIRCDVAALEAMAPVYILPEALLSLVAPLAVSHRQMPIVRWLRALALKRNTRGVLQGSFLQGALRMAYLQGPPGVPALRLLYPAVTHGVPGPGLPLGLRVRCQYRMLPTKPRFLAGFMAALLVVAGILALCNLTARIFRLK